MHAGAYAEGGTYIYVFSYSTRRDTTATVRVIAKTSIGLARFNLSLSSASLNFNMYLGLSLKPERISEYYYRACLQLRVPKLYRSRQCLLKRSLLITRKVRNK